MATILPLEEMKNYKEIYNLCKQDEQSPVYLTKDGYGKLVIITNDQYEQLLSIIEEKDMYIKMLESALFTSKNKNNDKFEDKYKDKSPEESKKLFIETVCKENNISKELYDLLEKIDDLTFSQEEEDDLDPDEYVEKILEIYKYLYDNTTCTCKDEKNCTCDKSLFDKELVEEIKREEKSSITQEEKLSFYFDIFEEIIDETKISTNTHDYDPTIVCFKILNLYKQKKVDKDDEFFRKIEGFDIKRKSKDN